MLRLRRGSPINRRIELGKPALAVTLMLVFESAAKAGEQTWFDFEAGLHENIGNAERSRDIVDDEFLIGTINRSYNRSVGDTASLGLRVFLQGQIFREIEELARGSAGVEGSFHFVSGPDPMAWGMSALIGLERSQQSVDQRSGNTRMARISLSKPVSLRVTADIGFEYKKRDSDSKVWDLAQKRGFLSGSYEFHPTWSASAVYSYIDGDVVSTVRGILADGSPAADIFGLVSSADEIERDFAFTDAHAGTWFSYRLPAYTNTFQYSIGKDLDDKLSVDLSVMDVDVSARGDNSYESRIFRVGLQRRLR